GHPFLDRLLHSFRRSAGLAPSIKIYEVTHISLPPFSLLPHNSMTSDPRHHGQLKGEKYGKKGGDSGYSPHPFEMVASYVMAGELGVSPASRRLERDRAAPAIRVR